MNAIIANGQTITTKLPCTIEEFLVAQKLLPRRVVVEHNGEAGAPSQRATYVVETEAVGDLGVEQADDMTPRAERAAPICHAGFARQTRHQMRRNEVSNLPQERELAGGWLDGGFPFHALPCGRAQTRKPTFFIP
ncbi:MAG: hypothetical protein M9920_03010 [Verrucomicrobiae bacterium]|nr:hypothetical protein [Verrucomicrobiae bacterium]